MPALSPGLYRLAALGLLAVALLDLAACSSPATRRAPLDNALVQQEQARQRDMAVRYSARQYQRLYRVAYPLLRAATPLCHDRLRPGMGYVLVSRSDFAQEMRTAASRVFGVDDGLQVLDVLPDSPAAQAGLHVGDRLLAVDGFQVATREGEEKRLHDYLRRGAPGAPRRVTVQRSGRPLTVTLRPDTLCDYGLGIVGSDAVNAMADGDNVILTKGMMRFAETDQELSLVVAHELAHNTMKHVDAKRSNATGGLILDVLAAAAGVNTQGMFQNIGASAYSQDFEAEADYVGMYIMARAGLPLHGAADFWRRMAAEHPAGIASNHAASHPASAERFLALQHTVQEIEAKEARHQPLLPDYQPRR